MNVTDPRRRIPRTDQLLALPEVVDAPLSDSAVRSIVAEAQAAARTLEITPEAVVDRVRARVTAARATSMTPVINATGVVVHTNIGRAPLSPDARRALIDAAGYADVEMDLRTGLRSTNRGLGAKSALLAACPGAEDALVVNNGAAALLLATTALAEGGEVIISRGELIEIGAGFRLPELIETAEVRLHEIGATNRTHPVDYERAAERETAKAILKVHPSNFRVEGFTAAVGTARLRPLADEKGLALIVDLGSGLLTHDPALPEEPDVAAEIAAGADVVIASGDKLLGGPQAGIILGKSWAIQKLKKHPLARAVRTDKLRLAALEATLTGREAPVKQYLHADPAELKRRAEVLAESVGGVVVAHDGRVGGGGAPGFPLPGYAVELAEHLAARLRAGDPVVLPRVHQGKCLVDLRCVPPELDETVAAAIARAEKEQS